jgi:hypothetical protein
MLAMVINGTLEENKTEISIPGAQAREVEAGDERLGRYELEQGRPECIF